ncbi:MAG: alanine--tRNA ligase [Actinomycetia bacterium]|nr:alanine--tRNA ligase [Actinomycetes bacterium]
MRSSELREKFLAFFESKGCKRLPSSSLIPDDPSMLLTSAGMVQFKPWFLQLKQLEVPYIGTTTVQKCVRTTDIDIIGTTGRHLSFFEMLGNFSFGAYFKQEMCTWALEFSTEVLGFDFSKLYFTVYLDDDETIGIWEALGVPPSHITRLGEADNFWRAGPTGPCGPCSELYYDQGPEVGCGSPDCAPGCDCDRFLEYWNLVFTQFDAQENGSLVPLPRKNIDTGMGLERTVAILQGVQSNYETDILRGLVAVGERLSGRSYGFGGNDDLSLRICADHSRAVTFMIGDGILPSNEGRGYVLRRLLRRAMMHGQRLGIEMPFLSHYVQLVIAEMGGVYPEISENQALIERVVLAEEERFAATLRLGQSYLEAELAALAQDGSVASASGFGKVGEVGANAADERASGVLDGRVAFELHDRYGFPIDLTVEIAAEQGFAVDRDGFDVCMRQQRQRARDAVKDDAWGSVGGVFTDIAASCGQTYFEGYERGQADATVLAIVVEADGQACRVLEIGAGQQAQLILDRTPFYGEMGGQIGDSGTISAPGRETAAGVAGDTGDAGDIGGALGVLFKVTDTQVHEQVYAHCGTAEGRIAVGDQVHAAIDVLRRERIERNHTATHLLHYALQQVLGSHVKQAGSLVAPERLRFDFTHFEPLTAEQLEAVEDMVNRLIMADSPVSSYQTSLDEARSSGVTALFGEKYGDRVRVLQAGSESRELCGGTHVRHTAQIGFLKITAESSVGASMRRIEAVTSFDALEFVKREERELHAAATLLKARTSDVAERIEALQGKLHEMEASLKAERWAALSDSADGLLAAKVDGVGYLLVIKQLDGLEVDEMRAVWDRLRQEAHASGAASADSAGLALVLGGVTPAGTPLLLAAANDAAIAQGFNAGGLIKQIAPLVKGGGGGRPNMAQAGGKDPAGLPQALEAARSLLVPI